jgi:hypothetical protein
MPTRLEKPPDQTETGSSGAGEPPVKPQSALTPRALFLAFLFGGLGSLWVVENSLVRSGVQVGGSVPPIPALATLALLALVNPKLGRWSLRRGEVLLVYLFVAVAVSLSHVDVLGYFFAYLTVPQYFSAREGFARVVEHLPPWFAPGDAGAVRTFYEGSWSFAVSWSEWLLPLAGWTGFFLALWATTFALLSLFRERWVQHEQLPFPIVDFTMSLTAESGRVPPALRDPVFWGGFALSGIYNLLNVVHAFQPNVPALGRSFDMAPFFPDLPWSALRPFWLSFRPEIFGIGYLINTDVLFTVWATYLAFRLCGVALSAAGYEIVSGYYDYQEIAAGAYLGMLAVLVWQARRQLRKVWRSGGPGLRLYATALGGFLYMLWWTTQAGLAWWLGALYLLLVVAFAVVYARMRAETGAPLIFLFPFWQQQKLLVNFLGTPALAAAGSESLSVLAAVGFLARGVLPELASYQVEAMAIGERARIRPRQVAVCLFAALLFGLLLGYYLYLTNAYRYGFGVLDGGSGQGGGRVNVTVQQYRMLAQWQGHYVPPNGPLIAQTLAGFGGALGMVALRQAFLACPLHPLGFAMATSYGFHLWFPFLAVWVCKLLILKLGGARGYRRLVPLFLGIVLGHYFAAGVLWGGLSLLSPEAARQYVVHFS